MLLITNKIIYNNNCKKNLDLKVDENITKEKYFTFMLSILGCNIKDISKVTLFECGGYNKISFIKHNKNYDINTIKEIIINSNLLSKL